MIFFLADYDTPRTWRVPPMEDAEMVHQFVKGAKAEEFERRMNELFKRVGLDYR